MKIIQGEKFQLLKNNNIYYCHTHDVNTFFKTNTFDKSFILISHNSDGKIISGRSNFPDASLDLAPKTLIKWFAQNLDVEDDRLVAIPIGLENNYIKNSNEKINTIINKNQEQKNIKNLAYLNFNICTNPNERWPVFQKFNQKSFVTTQTNVQYEEYFSNIYNHHFVFCPEGNGIDTHRTWETLYCGSIPIEKKNKNNIHFKDLPICLVDDWEQVTEKFLLEEYKRINKIEWNYKKLDFNYWKNLIEIISKNIN